MEPIEPAVERNLEQSVEMRDVVKRFARVVASDRARFDARRGEIHALVGENGAGKSTLMRILYGLVEPDAGTIRVNGRERRFRSPRDAIAAGIGMVHQHFMLVGPMTVGENIILGRESTRAGVLRLAGANRRLIEISRRHHLEVDPDARVRDLSVGAQQRVEILKVLFRGAGILILDEPTAVLTPQEAAHLFAVLRTLRDDGATVILITHRLEEVTGVADRVTVMRGGRTISTHEVAGISTARLADEMVGRELPRPPGRLPSVPGEPALELENVSARDDRGLPALSGVSLVVHSSEIVGVAGVAGNGQRELVEVATGLRAPTAGRVRLAGEDVTGQRRAAFLERGVAYVPEDRLERGIVGAFNVAENLVLGRHRGAPVAGRLALHRDAIEARARDLIAAHDIRPPDPGAPARTLSGGNQQKLIVARELEGQPGVLVAAEPTRGVDVGATLAVHERIREACRSGAGVLLVSAELTELLSLAHRVLVLVRGRVVAEVASADATPERLGRWMLGGAPDA